MFTKCGLWTIILLGIAYCAFLFKMSNNDLEGTICIVKEHCLSEDNKHKYIVYNDEYGTLEVTRKNNDFQIGDKIKIGTNCSYADLWRTCDNIFVTTTSFMYILIVIFLIGIFSFNDYIVEDDYGYIHQSI